MRVTRTDIAFVAALLVILAESAAIWMHPYSTQWDFAIYHHAARAYATGVNPYHLAPGGPAMEFVYPPMTLRLFQPMARLDFALAARLWLTLKLIALSALYLGWRRFFLPGIDRGLFALVVVLGFSATTLWDLRSGNSNLFEEFLLWSAFAAYLRGRYRLFTAGVVAAAAFKLLPLAFLLLLIAPSVPRRERWGVVIGVLAILVWVFAPGLARPEELKWFLGALNCCRPSGEVGPSILGFLDGLARWTSGDPDKAAWWPVVTWAVLSVMIGGMSRGLLRGAAANSDRRVLLFATVIVYALCVPRFTIYTGMLLLVPLFGFAWTLMQRGEGSVWNRIALALLFCVPGLERVPPKELGGLLSNLTPFFLTLGMWAVIRRTDLSRLNLPSPGSTQSSGRPAVTRRGDDS